MKRVFWLLVFLAFLSFASASADDNYIVVQQESKLCGNFIKWDSKNPNWLQGWWQALYLAGEQYPQYSENPACIQWDTFSCCRELWLRYAGVPIGVSFVSSHRFSAEFLAGKGIITARYLNPSEYKLRQNISRKEFLKIIMTTSWKEVTENCQWDFSDLSRTDWWCKYAEAALREWFIAENDTFRPNAHIWYAESLKLIFWSRDITQTYTDLSWEENYIFSSYYKGYIDTIPEYYQRAMTRWEVFEILARTYPEFSYRDF